MIDNKIVGAVLAGGRSIRMQRPDKFFMQLNGKPLLQHSLDLARPQVNELIICANGDLTRFQDYAELAIADPFDGYEGPLAGIISAMQWVQKTQKPYSWLVTFPSDTPYFPESMVTDLMHCAIHQGKTVVYPHCDNRSHYAFALWSTALLKTLQKHFNEGQRSLKGIIHQQTFGVVDYPKTPLLFENINTPQDWLIFHNNP